VKLYFILIKTGRPKGCCYFFLIKTLFLFATCLLLLPYFRPLPSMHVHKCFYCQVVVKQVANIYCQVAVKQVTLICCQTGVYVKLLMCFHSLPKRTALMLLTFDSWASSFGDQVTVNHQDPLDLI
ncbi:hypothetical protein SETIT_2G160500v2, partial [Setaria italica]